MIAIWTGAAIYMAGFAYCFYRVVIRWSAFRRQYGTIDTYNWVWVVLTGFWLAGSIAALAVWEVQASISN